MKRWQLKLILLSFSFGGFCELLTWYYVVLKIKLVYFGQWVESLTIPFVLVACYYFFRKLLEDSKEVIFSER